MLFAKYSRMDGLVTSDQWLGNIDQGGAGGSGWDAGYGTGDTKVQIGTVGFTWTVSPTVVVDATFGMMRFDQEATGSDVDQAYGLNVLGHPGDQRRLAPTRTTRGTTACPRSGSTVTRGSVASTAGARRSATRAARTTPSTPPGSRAATSSAPAWTSCTSGWTTGSPSSATRAGEFNHNGGYTALGPSGSPDQFNAYAQFLLGYQNSVGKSIQYELQTTP